MRGWLKLTFRPDVLPQLYIESQESDAEILTLRLVLYKEK